MVAHLAKAMADWRAGSNQNADMSCAHLVVVDLCHCSSENRRQPRSGQCPWCQRGPTQPHVVAAEVNDEVMVDPQPCPPGHEDLLGSAGPKAQITQERVRVVAPWSASRRVGGDKARGQLAMGFFQGPEPGAHKWPGPGREPHAPARAARAARPPAWCPRTPAARSPAPGHGCASAPTASGTAHRRRTAPDARNRAGPRLGNCAAGLWLRYGPGLHDLFGQLA